MGDVRIWRLPRYSRGACHAAHLGTGVPVRFAVNHQLESRVREIRTHGSEGGGAGYSTGSSYPYRIGRNRSNPRGLWPFDTPRMSVLPPCEYGECWKQDGLRELRKRAGLDRDDRWPTGEERVVVVAGIATNDARGENPHGPGASGAFHAALSGDPARAPFGAPPAPRGTEPRRR